MKKISILTALFAAAAMFVHGAAFIYTPGQYIDGTTNVQVLAGTNATVGTVPASSTNYYNLPNVANNTNYWPAIPFPPSLNTTPWRYVGIQVLTTTNLGDKLTFRYAASVDNSHWTSNAFSFTTGPGATAPSLLTNLDALGFPFWSLQAIENPSASNVVGLVHQVSPKATAP